MEAAVTPDGGGCIGRPSEAGHDPAPAIHRGVECRAGSRLCGGAGALLDRLRCDPCALEQHRPPHRPGPGSTVGRGCRLRRTVVMGASVGAESQVEGAILCSRAKIGEGGFLYPGSVVGADTWLGDHDTLRPQVRLWPGLHIQAGSRVTSNLQVHGPGPGSLHFDNYGNIHGVIGGDVDTEQVMDLGSALASMGQVALGHCGAGGERRWRWPLRLGSPPPAAGSSATMGQLRRQPTGCVITTVCPAACF